MAGRRWVVYGVGGAVAVGAALLCDRWVYTHLVWAGVYENDWGRLLRIVGFLPTWGVVAAGLALLGRSGWRGAAGRVFVAAAAGGALAEVLKLLIRSERPVAALGAHQFRAWSVEHPFSTAGLGMPSSHTLVAFAGAAMLARCSPRGRVLWFALAAGCGATRVLSGAHFLSDVVAAAALGPVVAAVVWASSARWSPAVLDGAPAARHR